MSDQIQVVHDPARQRFAVSVDGELAGFAEYRSRSGGTRRDFTHTEIDPAYGGRGLGGTLVSAALEQTRAEGLTIIPHCPFVAAWLRRHPDFAGTVEWPAGAEG
ncbi:GNAT family N-acetyltransferase [Leucobacter sp. PH1c]|uniref:GNAT family N-acetyltransferase n=1 Tax=Leucobacter sp. PH1c TaxID=1397278 RepID=UPI000468B02E|nr:GNAT family N-acetyltransferase [Leucobacter sp. PH1c]